MTQRTHPRAADKTLALRVMQLELGKRLPPMFDASVELPPELSSLLLRIEQADQTAERSQ
jgi:hypothetical protein